MNLVVALDFRFKAAPDGSIWTSTAFSHSFWTRYLEVFDHVRIFARAACAAEPAPGDLRVDGESVSFRRAPFYRGPAQYLLKTPSIRRAAVAAIGEGDAVVVRAPAELATFIAPALLRAGRPYGVEVVGDPYDAFAPGAIRHPFRALFRWRNTRLLKRQCAGACGAAYVTGSSLQRRYRCPSHMAAVSDVELPSGYWEPPPGARPAAEGRRIVFVGSLEQMYKGPDVLLPALAICLSEDAGYHLTVVGEGRHLAELRRRAAALGIGDRVRFTGRLSPDAVRDELDNSSVFVLPSRAEGLPRAMLEAMARGLPCVASSVGGIPELLPPEDLVPAGDPAALARRILEVTRDRQRAARMSERNRRTAFQFRDEILRPRRIAFYRHVADATARWLERTGRSPSEVARACASST